MDFDEKVINVRRQNKTGYIKFFTKHKAQEGNVRTV